MKIFMLIKKLRYCGAFKMFMWLADALCKQGHSVTIMTFMPNDVNELNPNINWIKHDELANKNIFQKIHIIRREIKAINPDVSISFLLDANVYNIFACLGCRTKSIVCERNDPFKPGYRVLQFWKPWFCLAKGAVFQLPRVKEYYDNIKSPTAVIPNPVLCNSKTNIKPFAERCNIINILGRLDLFQKRHDVMIDAFFKFKKKYSDFKLVFYGDGPDKDKMKMQINKLGLSESVIFGGVTDKPESMMAQSKMFVLTSDFEGIPNSLIEAMSLGLPCISTDCRPGGASLLIDNNYNGFVVPPGNSDAIVNKMFWYMEHPEIADEMGAKAKLIGEKFSEQKIINLWELYLNSLV